MIYNSKMREELKKYLDADKFLPILKNYGITCYRLAKLIGTDRQHINKLLKKKKYVSRYTILRIKQAINPALLERDFITYGVEKNN